MHEPAIVHVVPTMAVASSGYSYVVARLSSELQRLGVASSVATVGSVDQSAFGSGITGFPRGPWPRRLFASGDLRRWLLAAASGGRCDLVHAHSLWAMTSVYPAEALRRTGRPFVISPHGTLAAAAMRSGSWLKSPFWHLLQRPAVRMAACLHATAESEHRDIRIRGLTAPVAIIPNGVDIPDIVPVEESPRRKVLFLSRIHPIKQPERLIAAWADLERRFVDWDLQIAGADHDSPGYLGQMRVLASRLGLRRVDFIGEVVGPRKWDTYRAADLYVLPSKSENFGVTVAEALASGIPAVATKGAPWSDLPSRKAGWWIDDDVESIRRALEVAMSMPRHRLKAMGAAGREWVAGSFGWPTVAGQFLDLYQWILAGCCGESRPNFVRLD